MRTEDRTSHSSTRTSRHPPVPPESCASFASARGFIHGVDLRRDGYSVPGIDSLRTLPLSVLAGEPVWSGRAEARPADVVLTEVGAATDTRASFQLLPWCGTSPGHRACKQASSPLGDDGNLGALGSLLPREGSTRSAHTRCPAASLDPLVTSCVELVTPSCPEGPSDVRRPGAARTRLSLTHRASTGASV